MPSIERRGRRWRVVWREGGRGSARHVEYCTTKPEAKALAARIESRLAATRAAPRFRPIPWPELVERFAANRRKAGRTAQHIADTMATLSRLGVDHRWASTADLGPAGIEALLLSHRRALRAFLRYAVSLDQPVDQRLHAALRPPTARRKPSILLDGAQVRDLIAAATEWHPANGTIAALIALYGHRAQSLVGLDGAAVDLPGATLTLPVKSGDTHRHPLLPETVDLLRALDPTPGRALFVGHLGRPFASGQEYASWWNHQIARGRRGLGILDLRRHAITHMLEATSHDAKTVASITGHRTPSLLLNVYARTTEQRQRNALTALGATRCHPGKS